MNEPRNRAERRAALARARLRVKRAISTWALSRRLALVAKAGAMSRNEARRRLRAEVGRRYGAAELKWFGPKLVAAKDAAE